MVAGSCSLAGLQSSATNYSNPHFKFIYYLKTGQCNTNNLALSQRSFSSNILSNRKTEKLLKKYIKNFAVSLSIIRSFIKYLSNWFYLTVEYNVVSNTNIDNVLGNNYEVRSSVDREMVPGSILENKIIIIIIFSRSLSLHIKK